MDEFAATPRDQQADWLEEMRRRRLLTSGLTKTIRYRIQ